MNVSYETLDALSKEELIEYIMNYLSPERAKVGEGTQAGKRLRKLNKNHLLILKFFDDSRMEGRGKWSIRKLRDELYEQRIWRYDRHDKYVCCYWDYHHLQATCSILVGAGFLTMTDFQQNYFDEDAGCFDAIKAPQYFATSQQSLRFRRISRRGYPFLVHG